METYLMKCSIGKIGILFVKFPFSGESLSGGNQILKGVLNN